MKGTRYSGISPDPVSAYVTGPDGRSLVKSAARVLEILELFSERGEPLRAVDISEQLTLPRSSTLGLVRTMVETGYLLFNPRNKTYFPTLRVARLGEIVFQGALGQAGNLMRALNQATGECTILSVQNGLQMQFVALLPPTGAAPPQIEGMKTRMIGSACGSALLMTKSDQDIIAMVKKIRSGAPASALADEIEMVLDRIRGFRHRGYASSWKESQPGIRTIAVPLISERIAPVILSIGGPEQRIRAGEQENVALMRNLARRAASLDLSPQLSPDVPA